MTTVDRLIPSVDEAAWDYVGAIAAVVWLDLRCWCRGGPRCAYCCWADNQAEAASVALDMALSVGRSFDRARQQAIWQARADAALVAGVAW